MENVLNKYESVQTLSDQQNKARKFCYTCNNGWYEVTDATDDNSDGRSSARIR